MARRGGSFSISVELAKVREPDLNTDERYPFGIRFLICSLQSDQKSVFLSKICLPLTPTDELYCKRGIEMNFQTYEISKEFSYLVETLEYEKEWQIAKKI